MSTHYPDIKVGDTFSLKSVNKYRVGDRSLDHKVVRVLAKDGGFIVTTKPLDEDKINRRPIVFDAKSWKFIPVWRCRSNSSVWCPTVCIARCGGECPLRIGQQNRPHCRSSWSNFCPNCGKDLRT